MSDLTLKETAKILSVSYNRLYTLASHGQFPAYQIGRGWRVKPNDLERFRNGEYSSKKNKRSTVTEIIGEACQSSSAVSTTIFDLNSKVKSYDEALEQASGKKRCNSKQS